MGILSDFLLSPVGEIGYGAMAESYERANKKADDQRELFRGLGQDLRAERAEAEQAAMQQQQEMAQAQMVKDAAPMAKVIQDGSQ